MEVNATPLESEAATQAANETTRGSELETGGQPSDTQPESQGKSDIELRYKEAQKALSQQGEAVKAYSRSLANLVRKDPSYLEEIESLKLRDTLAQEVLGVSYQEYQEQQEVEGLRGTADYETKREIFELKKRLSQKEAKERELVETNFLAQKNISKNELDGAYEKLQEAIGKLNPTFVSDNYSDALKIAYSMAFPNTATPPRKEDAQISLALGKEGGATGANPLSSQPEKKGLNAKEADFLRQIGATKTLKKFSS